MDLTIFILNLMDNMCRSITLCYKYNTTVTEIHGLSHGGPPMMSYIFQILLYSSASIYTPLY